jgi:hypothetical protein
MDVPVSYLDTTMPGKEVVFFLIQVVRSTREYRGWNAGTLERPRPT